MLESNALFALAAAVLWGGGDFSGGSFRSWYAAKFAARMVPVDHGPVPVDLVREVCMNLSSRCRSSCIQCAR